MIRDMFQSTVMRVLLCKKVQTCSHSEAFNFPSFCRVHHFLLERALCAKIILKQIYINFDLPRGDVAPTDLLGQWWSFCTTLCYDVLFIANSSYTMSLQGCSLNGLYIFFHKGVKKPEEKSICLSLLIICGKIWPISRHQSFYLHDRLIANWGHVVEW